MDLETTELVDYTDGGFLLSIRPFIVPQPSSQTLDTAVVYSLLFVFSVCKP